MSNTYFLKMKKIVLLCAGSFNPVTFMHIRMFVLAKDHLYKKLQWQVVGGLLSPVHDSYKKKDLASGKDRRKMVELCVEEYRIPWIKMSEWELEQTEWRKTLESLQYHHDAFQDGSQPWFSDVRPEDQVQTMLLCGSDVLASFCVPGLWDESHVERIMSQHGVVCITRSGSLIEDVVNKSPVLSRFRENIVIVPEWYDNLMSSTSIRSAVRKGQCIGMLVPISVAEYIEQERLYLTEDRQKKKVPVAFMYKAVRAAGHLDGYQEVLEQKGWKVVQIPVITFQYTELPRLRDALWRPEEFSGLILTSPRAVEALFLAVKPGDTEWRNSLCSAWKAKPVYVTGEGTAQLAATAGLDTVEKESGNEKELAKTILANKERHTKPLLFPCGNLRLDTLPNALADSGINLESVQCYETVQNPELLCHVTKALRKEGFPDVNVFFSPSGVQFMDSILRSESLAFKQTKYAAIGPTTAEALSKFGYGVDAVADRPSPDSLAEALTKLS